MRLENWTCRASQLGVIMTGNIGLTKNQSDELNGLIQRKADFEAGNQKLKLTPIMEEKMRSLAESEKNKDLPKTVQSELRNIFRQIKYNRFPSFTNKYVQKGNMLEESAITLLSKHIGKPLLKYRGERIKNEFFQGLPDIVGKPKGFDTKCCWSLRTFPWKDEKLDPIYEWQNQCYMDLTGIGNWATAKCLVNTNQVLLEKEIKHAWYANNCPEISSDEWISIAKEIEKDMIFDFKQFINHYPNYIPYHSIEEWQFDIPESERIIIFESEYSKDRIAEAKDRVIIGREYLKSLESL